MSVVECSLTLKGSVEDPCCCKQRLSHNPVGDSLQMLIILSKVELQSRWQYAQEIGFVNDILPWTILK